MTVSLHFGLPAQGISRVGTQHLTMIGAKVLCAAWGNPRPKEEVRFCLDWKKWVMEDRCPGMGARQVQAALGTICKGALRLRDLEHPKRRPELPYGG